MQNISLSPWWYKISCRPCFFGFPVKKHLELMPWNDLHRQLKMVLKYCFRPCLNKIKKYRVHNYCALYILHMYFKCLTSICHSVIREKYVNMLFSFLISLYVYEKKNTRMYLPSTVKKNSPWSEPVIITSLPTKYNTRHKSWNTCAISPFPNIDLGIAVISVPHNMCGSTLGKERGTFEWEKRCEEWM